MSQVPRYSRLAERDLDDIAAYTIREWGEAQASRYLNDLQDCCERIAPNPGRGRRCDAIAATLRRTEQGSHVVFYHSVDGATLIVRILHKSMLPDLHDLEIPD